MRFPSMLRRLRNTRGGGTRSTAASPYPYPYTAKGPEVRVLVTLDDGPDSRPPAVNRTKRVLDKLKALADTPFGQVNAVFFVQTHALDSNGNFNRGMSDRGQQLLNRMGREGHMAVVHTGAEVIGAHSSDNYHTERLDELVADLNQAWNDCLTVYGYGSYIGRYVRPPAGAYSDAVLSKYREANLKWYFGMLTRRIGTII